MKKQLLTLLLAAGLMLTAFVPTHAADLVNSTGSDASATGETWKTVGSDTTQGKVTEYYPDVAVNTTTYTSDVAVSVHVTKGSMIKLSSPKTLILGVGATNAGKTPATGSYKIGLLGDLGGTQKISVTYPTSIVMSNGTKTVTAAMTAIQKDWTWNQVNPTTFTYATSTISIADILAGAYTGTFNVHYVVTN